MRWFRRGGWLGGGAAGSRETRPAQGGAALGSVAGTAADGPVAVASSTAGAGVSGSVSGAAADGPVVVAGARVAPPGDDLTEEEPEGPAVMQRERVRPLRGNRPSDGWSPPFGGWYRYPGGPQVPLTSRELRAG